MVRFNSLICSTLSTNGNLLNSSLVTINGLSYNKCCSILFPLILKSSFLCNSIRRIHFDGRNVIVCDLSCQWLFNDLKLLHFPNLKSFAVTHCERMKPVFESLLYLIEYQLDELTLKLNKQVFERFFYVQNNPVMVRNIGKSIVYRIEQISRKDIGYKAKISL